MKKKTAQKKNFKIGIKIPKVINIATVKRYGFPIATVAVVVLIGLLTFFLKGRPTENSQQAAISPTPTMLPSNIIPLPQLDYRSTNSIEAVLRSRRTKREIKPDQLTLKQVGQMLWSAQGVTTDWGGRTTPSSKSTYPLTVYLLVNKVEKLENGFYKYIPGDRLPAHQLTPLKLADFKDTIYDITNQSSMKEPPAMIIVTGNMEKMADAFGGERHDKEVYLEAGHAGQNMYLQAESLKLGMVVISSFEEAKFRNLLSIPTNETIIYLIPFGYAKE